MTRPLPDQAIGPPPGYAPGNVPDEMVDAEGRVRPVWRPFLAAFSRMPSEEREARFGRADRYLRDAGVYYRVYGDQEAPERDWPLSHVPVLIGAQEWRGLVDGLSQRAELLEALAADLYGPARLVADGLIPPEIVAASPEYLRPLVGVRPASGHFLHFLSFDLGRGPDGGWWVLGDRTQAPSGAGFAIENRVATLRAFPDLAKGLQLARLGDFFRRFRETLQGLCRTPGGRIGILTPGPLNETYYEQAYIARYLGVALLEGEDLTVADGRVMVRTVGGLRPVDVLWRRLDADFADPIELNQQSRIGTPGLVAALRAGGVSLVNALGTGVLETRALLAFLPALAERLTGEPLRLPSIATWWCGDAAARAHVLDNLTAMMIGPALSTRLPFEDAQATLPGAGLGSSALEAARRWIAREGRNLVCQEAVTLSTTPSWQAGALVPRPMVLRVFAARTARGWRFMPGGFARIGASDDPTAIAMQRGGSAADVWIVGTGAGAEEEAPAGAAPARRLSPGNLPSRAADNLYWLGRYVERAEGTVRMLRALHVRVAESDEAAAPLVAALSGHLESLGIDDAPVPEALMGALRSAMTSAGHVRDRFSVDGWLALKDLDRTLRGFRSSVTPGDDAAAAMTVLLRKTAGFAGLLHENMYRFMGWRFLVTGRALERALTMAGLLARLGQDDGPDGAPDLLLEVGDSVLTHRRRYAVPASPATVRDLLGLDRLNPRSLLAQLDAVHEQAESMPGAMEHGQMSPLMRDVLRARTLLALETPETLDRAKLEGIAAMIAGISDSLTMTYLA